MIYPNVRGSSGYGKTYVQLDNAQQREDSVRDIGALLDWIEQQPELDSSRIAVSGGSYGGYMVPIARICGEPSTGTSEIQKCVLSLNESIRQLMPIVSAPRCWSLTA